MLTVENLQAGYGAARVLFGVGFSIGAGETVTLLGRNGMGKTTTVKSIMGLIRPTGGSIRFEARDFTGAAPFRIAQAGIGLVPEGRQVFPTLDVEENLIATAAGRFGAPRQWRRGFPQLSASERSAGPPAPGRCRPARSCKAAGR